LALSLVIHDANHQYAVQHLLNLVNELYLHVVERYPEYAAAHFGLSLE
jgi:hypothetical protein